MSDPYGPSPYQQQPDYQTSGPPGYQPPELQSPGPPGYQPYGDVGKGPGGYPPYPEQASAPPPMYAYPGAPGGYQPPYGGYPAGRGTNGMAIASLVVSCAAFFVCGLLACVGAILGHVARKQIRESGQEGDGMALAGIIVGWIITGLSVVVLVAYVVFFVWAVNQDPSV
ncbi:MAG: DUF4190 domain-containing protein [Micromonosporaceae bacterium]